MAALPYIQLYVADYLADTMHLSAEEHGAYLLLIMNYWQTGKPIPKKRLHSIARLSNDRWKSVEDSLSEYFTEDERGYWVHSRIEQDLHKVKSKSDQASAAGKASAAKRAKSKATENKSESSGRSTGAQRESNHTDKDKDTDTDTDKRESGSRRKKFSPPTETDLHNYASEENLNLNGFYDYYESIGWVVGRAKNKMKCWKASARNWHRRQPDFKRQDGRINSEEDLKRAVEAAKF